MRVRVRGRNKLGLASVGALLVVLAACSPIKGTSATGPTPTVGAPGSGSTQKLNCSNSAIQSELYTEGKLTIATDDPVYVPWFVANRPENGLGYEAAVSYAVAKYLGFSKSQVKWVYEPFNDSYAPGPKKFDFDVDEVSITPERAQAVTFSIGYYNDTQALLVMKNQPIAKDYSPNALSTYLYGDQVGTTSLAFINSAIKPTQTSRVYGSLNDAQAALTSHQIQALVTDTPTAQYMATTIPGSTVLGQFPASGEQFGLLFAKGNPLVACVDEAITHITSDGQISQFSQKWLKIYDSIPTIKP